MAWQGKARQESKHGYMWPHQVLHRHEQAWIHQETPFSFKPDEANPDAPAFSTRASRQIC